MRMATARSCKPDQWVKMNSRWLIVLRRVRPVHQCATEIFRPFGALYRRLAGLSRLSRRSTRRKPPETPTVFGSSSPIIKSCNINYLWWLGDQDSNLNDPSYNPLKCRHNLRCRSVRDKNMTLKGKELWGRTTLQATIQIRPTMLLPDGCSSGAAAARAREVRVVVDHGDPFCPARKGRPELDQGDCQSPPI